ncbi:hypothetical protein BDV93DRAFT_557948 [Ceratobasidium sp. AG-I]|nr:hypothetical protein BDV93DRAFT_557948 [Ceratobasidium sp. AG-I]
MPSPRFSGARLQEIFPGGFDKHFGQCSSISRSAKTYEASPQCLYMSLIERHNPETPLESIIVKSAWYGKQTKGAQHEFIVVQVEDKNIQGLTNYLVLDRNVDAEEQNRTVLGSSSTIRAKDTFRISYDGDIDKLLKHCRIKRHRFLEKLSFPSDMPLHLYELVTLADVVSERYPNYRLIDSSCYLFAGAIWECMRLICPSVIRDNNLEGERGRFHWIRYVPSASEIYGSHQAFQTRLPHLGSKFGKYREEVNTRKVNDDPRGHEK